MIDQTEIEVKVKRSDLIYLKRVLDSLHPLIEEIVCEGDESDDVLIELDDAQDMVRKYLG